jgi:hypothetical protein
MEMGKRLGYVSRTGKIYLHGDNGGREDITDEFVGMVLLKFKPGYVHSLKSEDGSREYTITVMDLKEESGGHVRG